MEHVKIQDITLPVIGLGTWALHGKQCTKTIQTALDLGYRHIDTAQMYGNEQAVGNALTETSISREDVFLTTKIMNANLRPGRVLESVRESLQQLQTDYLDLLLIHWPSSSVPIPDTIHAMNTLQDEGLVKHIGVSNFSVSQVKEAREASETPLLTNQVEYHPLRDQAKMVKFCYDNEMLLTAYSPLAKSRVLRNSTLSDIGRKHGKSPAQVALRWLIQQQNVIVIPKASGPAHLRENLDIFDFELLPEETKQIYGL